MFYGCKLFRVVNICAFLWRYVFTLNLLIFLHSYVGSALTNANMHMLYLRRCLEADNPCSSLCYFSDRHGLLGPVPSSCLVNTGSHTPVPDCLTLGCSKKCGGCRNWELSSAVYKGSVRHRMRLAVCMVVYKGYLFAGQCRGGQQDEGWNVSRRVYSNW